MFATAVWPVEPIRYVLFTAEIDFLPGKDLM